MLVDFHMHTTYSDGRLTPKEIVKMAKEENIRIISITDHDDFEALSDLSAADLTDIQLVPGIEFSSTYKDKDVHILGYQYDLTNKRLCDYVAFFKEERRTRIIKMINRCEENGYHVTYEELISLFGENKSLGRPHLAQLLMKKNYVRSVNEAFATLLHSKGACYVPKFKAHPEDVLDIIREAGGISILAHPVLLHNDQYVSDILDMGIDGIEVYHARHNTLDEGRYLEMALKRNILISGGSDYHALPDRYPSRLGEIKIESSQVKNFLQRLGIDTK